MRVTSIHQIEITSRCNLTCKYCMHPKMLRDKVDMSLETFNHALKMVKHCVDRYGQNELNLAGIGESTMHPNFSEMVLIAHNVVGRDCRLVLATNGVSLTQKHVDSLKSVGAYVWVSLHRPEKAGPAIEMLKKAGVLKGISADPSIASIDWAGQVDWHVSTKVKEPCPWLSLGHVMVTSLGQIVTCCLDGDGRSLIGNVQSSIEDINVLPYELCVTCHLEVPDSMHCSGIVEISKEYAEDIMSDGGETKFLDITH